jgi:integrase/recombinase XerD
MKKRPIPDVLTPEEQARLMDCLPSGTLLQRRNLGMVRLMLNAGLRSQEVCDLRLQDFHWPSGRVKIRGKGGRQRVLWLSDDDLSFLKSYAAEAAPSSFLFETGPGKQVCTRFLRCLMARLGTKTGLSKRLHPHLLRHSFATDLLRQTKNLPLVQKAMGHADIGTTQIYLHIMDDEMEDAMKNFRR